MFAFLVTINLKWDCYSTDFSFNLRVLESCSWGKDVSCTAANSLTEQKLLREANVMYLQAHHQYWENMNAVSVTASGYLHVGMHACFQASFFGCSTSCEASKPRTLHTCWLSSPGWIPGSDKLFPGKVTICAFLYGTLQHCCEALQFHVLISVREKLVCKPETVSASDRNLLSFTTNPV